MVLISLERRVLRETSIWEEIFALVDPSTSPHVFRAYGFVRWTIEGWQVYKTGFAIVDPRCLEGCLEVYPLFSLSREVVNQGFVSDSASAEGGAGWQVVDDDRCRRGRDGDSCLGSGQWN